MKKSICLIVVLTVALAMGAIASPAYAVEECKLVVQIVGVKTSAGTGEVFGRVLHNAIPGYVYKWTTTNPDIVQVAVTAKQNGQPVEITSAVTCPTETSGVVAVGPIQWIDFY